MVITQLVVMSVMLWYNYFFIRDPADLCRSLATFSTSSCSVVKDENSSEADGNHGDYTGKYYENLFLYE